SQVTGRMAAQAHQQSKEPIGTEPLFSELLDSARAGSTSALGSLCDLYRDQLRHQNRAALPAYLQYNADRSDLIQEAFFSAVSRFDSFRGSTEHEWLSWLTSILERKQLNFLRSYRDAKCRQIASECSLNEQSNASQPQQLQAADPTPSGLVSAQEQAERLGNALSQISEDYKQAIELRHREQLSFAEIGKVMNRTEEAARKLWARGVQKLGRILIEDADP
ncbi:MAG: sigma-70 family RNA polymerase sigma factor, partial [Planctomycetota bacterium]